LLCFVFQGESPGCRLFSTASMLEWLINPPTPPPPPPLTGEQYGKMEPKYPKGGHCQSIYVQDVVSREINPIICVSVLLKVIAKVALRGERQRN